MLRNYLTPMCQDGSHRTEVLRPCPALSQVASTDSDSELSGWRAGLPPPSPLSPLPPSPPIFCTTALSILGAQEWRVERN